MASYSTATMACISLLFLMACGCVSPDVNETVSATPITGNASPTPLATATLEATATPQATPEASAAPTAAATSVQARAFRVFTDPNEGAFTIEVPEGWAVTGESGLDRPYIDARITFEAKSPEGQSFFFQSPYDYLFQTPNDVLTRSGFPEGSLYPTGLEKPMKVKSYLTAPEFAAEFLANGEVHAANVKTTETPLPETSNPLITRQSASETTFDYFEAEVKTSGVLVVKTALMQQSITGVWLATVMEYKSPAVLMNETELLVLSMQRSLKVDSDWAARENAEIQKRAGAIAQGAADISATLSSSFETRSSSMDEMSDKWENSMLGVEDAYNTETGDHYVVDSGYDYYWSDSQGHIYGTNTDDSPLPGEGLHQLDCPGCQT